MRKPEDLARRAYNAYGEHARWTNYLGTPMPEWPALSPVIQSHWIAVATAFLDGALSVEVGDEQRVTADRSKPNG